MHGKIYFFNLILICFPLFFQGQQIENPGFEYWETVGNFRDEPVNWSTIKTCDDEGIASLAPVTYDISTDAHSGNYALKLYNLAVGNLSATGAICNGRFHAEFNLDKSYSYTDPSDPQWCLPFTARPDSLTGWFRYFPQGNDAAQFKAILHVDSCKLPENGTLPNWVGMAVYKSPHGITFDSWTRFSVPFTYYDNRTPEFMLCVMNSGDSTISIPGSYLFIDDIELKYPESGVQEMAVNRNFVILSDRSLVIDLPSEEYLNCPFSLIDLAGQAILSQPAGDNRIPLPSGLKTGLYIATLDGRNGKYVQKVMIR